VRRKVKTKSGLWGSQLAGCRRNDGNLDGDSEKYR